MSAPVTPGSHRILPAGYARAARRRCLSFALAAFLAGGALGLYAGHAAWAASASPIKATLAQTGQYLCKQYLGLKEIWRVGPQDYGFSCHGIAVFPKVEITMEER